MEDRIVNFDEPAQRIAIVREIQALRGMQRITVVKARPRRSDRQNRYYWPVFIGSMYDFCKAQGSNETHDQLHEMFKVKFLRKPVINQQTGELIGQAIRSTTELTTTEFNEYLDKIAMFLAEMGIVVPDPSEYREKDVDMQQMR